MRYDVGVSQLSVVKEYALLNRVRSRSNSLRWHYESLCKKDHEAEGSDVLYQRDAVKMRWLLKRLVHYSIICNGGYFYCGYSRFFNKHFGKSTKDHCIRVLGFYVPRKADLYGRLRFLERSLQYQQRRLCVLRGDSLGVCKNEIARLTKEIVKEQHYVNFTVGVRRKLRERCLLARKSEMEKRLALELEQRCREGWYVVFNTLTVEVFSRGKAFGARSNIWSDYVRSVDRGIGIECFGSWREAVEARKGGSEFHQYFAVVERGHNSGHLHIHVVHLCRKLPYGCNVDPNAGLLQPNRREIDGFKEYWKYGFSTPMAVRFSDHDAFGKAFWRWPVEFDAEKGKYVPIPANPPVALVKYVSKYMVKEFDKPKSKEIIQWRVRISRKMGQQVVDQIISRCSRAELQSIVGLRTSKPLQIRNRSLPFQFLRRHLLRHLLRILMIRRPSLTWASLHRLPPRVNLLKQLESMILTNWSHKLLSFGSIKIPTLLLTDVCKKIREVELFLLGAPSWYSAHGGTTQEVIC